MSDCLLVNVESLADELLHGGGPGGVEPSPAGGAGSQPGLALLNQVRHFFISI